MSIDITTLKSSDLPPRVMNLPQPPKSLYSVGIELSDLLMKPSLSVVGSRKVSKYGRAVTENLVEQASKSGVCIISGLALGVDSIAHQAAVNSFGKTIAVLPSGIKKIYPASHTGLARSIVAHGGAIVSEYSHSEMPMKHQFIERNRIIAALGDALLVAEAAEKSGSLHTARFALELGKPVLAVPGNIDSPTSTGTNNLIKMGATPVTSIEDILQTLGIDQTTKQPRTIEAYGENENETTILSLLRETPMKGSDLHHASALDAADYQQTLTMLEIKGRIRPLGNDTWASK